MDTVVRRSRRRRLKLDLKTLNLALELCDTIFQTGHAVAARIVHAEGVGPFVYALPKALEHRCALLCSIIALILSAVSREPAPMVSRRLRSDQYLSASPSARQG